MGHGVNGRIVVPAVPDHYIWTAGRLTFAQNFPDCAPREATGLLDGLTSTPNLPHGLDSDRAATRMSPIGIVRDVMFPGVSFGWTAS